MKNFLAAATLVAFLTVSLIGIAHAQDAIDPGHPRVNEIDQRLNDQQNRVDTGVQDNQMGAKQEMHDSNTDAHVSQELSKDESKDGGHVTKAQQRKMNRQLNRNSRRIHRQRTHPRVATPAVQ